MHIWLFMYYCPVSPCYVLHLIPDLLLISYVGSAQSNVPTHI